MRILGKPLWHDSDTAPPARRLYLAQVNCVLERLGPGVEVHRLLDVVLVLVLAGQVIRSCPVSSLVCYFSCLTGEREREASADAGVSCKTGCLREGSWREAMLTFWMFPWKQ